MRELYTGDCYTCKSTSTPRWYRKANPLGVICKSCYDKIRLQNPKIRSRRIADRRRWSFENPYKDAKKMAKSRGSEFTLSESYYLENIKVCFYCSSSLESNKFGIKLDRIDSSKGYIEGNIVGCCKQCNVAKNNYSLREFLEWVLKLDIAKIKDLVCYIE
jgi:hypothetical protein